ncbi:MAG TPA: hypothetical protein VJB70_02895 [Candidatus Paceibacterota bacterium]
MARTKKVARQKKKIVKENVPLQKSSPVATSRVDGFAVVVARKNKEDGAHNDMGEHFEITASYDGTNELYVHVEKRDWRIVLTHELLKHAECRKDMLVFSFPTGTVFTGIEIVEEDAPWCPVPGLDGKEVPSVMVWVVISFKKSGTLCKSPEKWGIAVRPKG